MNEKHETPETTEASGSGFAAATDLRSAREALGLSLRDIFVATRVSLVNLQAVEDEDFDRLPPPVYARNFIYKYARAVGVDEKPLLARYGGYLEKKNPPRAEEEVRQPWPENGRRWRFLVLSLVAVILVGSLVYAVFLYDQAATLPPPAVAPAGTVAPTEPKPAESEAPAFPTSPAVMAPATPTPAATLPSAPAAAPAAIPPATPAPAAGEGYRLVLTARELTWLRITQDRNPAREILLRPGEKIERKATDYFLLDIGNAGGLNLSFQGQDLGTLGKSGQTLHLRLPARTATADKTP